MSLRSIDLIWLKSVCQVGSSCFASTCSRLRSIHVRHIIFTKSPSSLAIKYSLCTSLNICPKYGSWYRALKSCYSAFVSSYKSWLKCSLKSTSRDKCWLNLKYYGTCLISPFYSFFSFPDFSLRNSLYIQSIFASPRLTNPENHPKAIEIENKHVLLRIFSGLFCLKLTD